MARGYDWDGMLPVFPNEIGVGERPFGLTFEQIQRWQCRLDLWDSEGQWADPIGGNATYTLNYGDNPPIDIGFHDFLSRLKSSLEFIVGFGVNTGSYVIGVQLSFDLGCLSNADQTLFYPRVICNGNTHLITDVFEYFPEISSVPQLDWVPFCTATIFDGVDTFSIPLFMKGPFPGTVLSLYQLDYLNFKATDYLLA